MSDELKAELAKLNKLMAQVNIQAKKEGLSLQIYGVEDSDGYFNLGYVDESSKFAVNESIK